MQGLILPPATLFKTSFRTWV